jgi:hypothetical protein
VVLFVIGLASISKSSGILYLLIGAALLVAYGWLHLNLMRSRLRDVAVGQALARTLGSGGSPAPVQPRLLSESGNQLEPGEPCYLDGSTVEVVEWYGDPVVLTRRTTLLFGSPMAWMFTAILNYVWWSSNRKKAKKAQPRWRDPENGQLWVTDRRLIMRSKQGNWSQIRWPQIRQASLDRDGLVLVLDEIDRPFKLRTEAASAILVLYRYALSGQIFTPQPLWWERMVPPALVAREV